MTKTITWLAAFAWLLVASLVSAAPKAAIVLVVEGSDTESTRGEVIAALPPNVGVQNPDEVRAAIAGHGVTLMADSLSNPRTRKQTLVIAHKTMKQLNAPALLSVRMKRSKGGVREMRVVLVVNDQTEPVVEEDITLGRTEKVSTKLIPLLQVPLEDVRPLDDTSVVAPRSAAPAEKPSRRSRRSQEPVREPPADTREDEPPPPPKARARERDRDRARERETEKEKELEPEASAEPTEAPQKDAVTKRRGKVEHATAMAIVEVAAEVGSRKMEYNQPLIGPLRGYLAPAMAAYAFSVQFYPGASTGTPIAKDIGIVGRYASALGLESKTSDGLQSVRTSWSRSAVGVRGRILTGAKTNSPLVGIEGTYGNSSFVFDGLDPVRAEVPSVRYQYIRAGIDGRVPYGAFAFYGGVGYMSILSAGEFSDRFTRASIAGVDGKLGAGYSVLPWIEARADATYTRIFSSLNPEPGDAYVAGGALDQYFVWHVGASAFF